MSVVRKQPNVSTNRKVVDNEKCRFSAAISVGYDTDTTHLLPLDSTDRVLVKPKQENIGVILGCDTQKTYELINDKNQTIFVVEQSSDFMERCWFGPLRPMFVHIMDGDRNTVIYLDRPLACQECCFPYSLQKMTVHSPPGHVIGTIEQKWGCRPILHVKDITKEVQFIIKGPYCQMSCGCGDLEFPIYGSDGKTIYGKVTNRWRGVVHEDVFEGDNFGLTFPLGINPQMKALLIGAAFLTDYMYFENPIQ